MCTVVFGGKFAKDHISELGPIESIELFLGDGFSANFSGGKNALKIFEWCVALTASFRHRINNYKLDSKIVQKLQK